MDMYKKMMIVFLVFLSFSNLHALAQDDRQYFKIYGDSQHTKQTYEVKNELIATYQQLVMGLETDEYSAALKNFFANHEQIEYKNHTLTMILGDGQGVVLEGELKTNYCAKESEEIETHFFFWELLTGN